MDRPSDEVAPPEFAFRPRELSRQGEAVNTESVAMRVLTREETG
jgi:hypothetical protein